MANPKNNRRYRPLEAADIYLKLRSDLYGYDPYFLEKIRLAEESNLKNSPVVLANPHLAKLLLKDKVKPGEILTDRDIIDSPYTANKVDSLAIWNSTINKLQQHEIAKQNAGNVNTNVPAKGGIFTDKDIIDSVNTVKNFVDTQHEIAKQNANNIPIVPKTPNNANNPPTGTNAGTGAGTKGTNKKDTGNAIGDAVKKKVNQDTKKNTNNGNTGKLNNSATDEVATEKVNEQPVMTPEQLAYEQAINASNGERSAIIQDYYNRHGVKKSVDNPKTALSEAQRDYYRYLTGYRQMAPNQAILSMGLDPNKYYY